MRNWTSLESPQKGVTVVTARPVNHSQSAFFPPLIRWCVKIRTLAAGGCKTLRGKRRRAPNFRAWCLETWQGDRSGIKRRKRRRIWRCCPSRGRTSVQLKKNKKTKKTNPDRRGNLKPKKNSWNLMSPQKHQQCQLQTHHVFLTAAAPWWRGRPI